MADKTLCNKIIQRDIIWITVIPVPLLSRVIRKE